MIQSFGLSENKACHLTEISRSSYRYKPRQNNDELLLKRLKEMAQQKRRYGCRRLHVILSKEGLVINHKRTERLYKLEGLSIRTKKRKKIAGMMRLQLPRPKRPDQIWAMDFAYDSLWDSRRIRCLGIVDLYSRESVEIKVDTSIPARAITMALDRLKETRGVPEVIVVDNGPEFTSKAFDEWAYSNNVMIYYIRPGKPTDNAFAESFIGRFRDECLNEHWFVSLNDAKEKIEQWRIDYNHNRPHSALNMLSPMEFVRNEMLTTSV